MAKRSIFILLWLAVVACIFIGALTSLHAQVDTQLQYEVLQRHAILIMLLTLPSGWILSALASAIASVINFQPVGATDAFMVSLSCAIGGYFQWFILMPWVWRKWKAKRDVHLSLQNK